MQFNEHSVHEVVRDQMMRNVPLGTSLPSADRFRAEVIR